MTNDPDKVRRQWGFIANSRAVMGAGVARGTGIRPFRPDRKGVFTLFSDKLRAKTRQVIEEARRQMLSTEEAGLEIAQGRVRRAMELKGRVRRQRR